MALVGSKPKTPFTVPEHRSAWNSANGQPLRNLGSCWPDQLLGGLPHVPGAQCLDRCLGLGFRVFGGFGFELALKGFYAGCCKNLGFWCLHV